MRRQQEEKALLNYQQALALAKFAEKSELEQQWSIAVTHWQKALMALKQIPLHSFLMEQVRPLLTTYNLALQQAQNRLKTTLRSQNIKRDLEALCSQWNRACDYSISPEVIKVRLTSGYVQQIWDSALQAKSQGNVSGQAGVLNHISQLEQTFQAISNESGLPLELYHAKGNRLTRYQPIQ
jgi:glycine cleavage system regulatory protein